MYTNELTERQLGETSKRIHLYSHTNIQISHYSLFTFMLIQLNRWRDDIACNEHDFIIQINTIFK